MIYDSLWDRRGRKPESTCPVVPLSTKVHYVVCDRYGSYGSMKPNLADCCVGVETIRLCKPSALFVTIEVKLGRNGAFGWRTLRHRNDSVERR